MKRFILIFLLMLSIGCSPKDNGSNSQSLFTLELYDNIFEIDSNLIKLLSDYLNDPALDNIQSYFIYFGQNSDTLVTTVYPIIMDINISQIQPLGMIKFKNKQFYIITHLSKLIVYKQANFINEEYQSSLKDIPWGTPSSNKLWMMKMPIYSDKVVVVKNRNLIIDHLRPNVIDSI